MIEKKAMVRVLVVSGVLVLLCKSAVLANPAGSLQLSAGVWRSATGLGTSTREYPLTILGQKRYENFRLDQDPSLQCEPPGMPRGFSPRSPMDFNFSGNTLTVRYETMDVVRIVHMNGASPPPNKPRTPNGHAIGRWDGETLVIETTHLTAGEVNRNGIPKSEAMTLYETFDLQKRDDDTYLIINLTITDPENFTEPHTSTEVFVLEPNWELFPFECHPTEY